MRQIRTVLLLPGPVSYTHLDNELQEAKGIYEDGQVYLPVDWVDDYVNQRFYWDDGEKLLVYALSLIHICAGWTGSSAGSALDAGISVDNVLAISLRDCTYWTFARDVYKRQGL